MKANVVRHTSTISSLLSQLRRPIALRIWVVLSAFMFGLNFGAFAGAGGRLTLIAGEAAKLGALGETAAACLSVPPKTPAI